MADVVGEHTVETKEQPIQRHRLLPARYGFVDVNLMLGQVFDVYQETEWMEKSST